MNPYILEVIVQEKRREMLEEANRRQLLRAYRATRPNRLAGTLAALGEKLIFWGEKLKYRYGCNMSADTNHPGNLA